MDTFFVEGKKSEVLKASLLVEEMGEQAKDFDAFPVLLGTHIGKFHSVDGGYHRSEGYHVVNLIHEVQGPGSPFNGDVQQPSVEAHLDDYFYLEVEDVREYAGAYGGDGSVQQAGSASENYVLSLQVTGYQRGPYSFSEEMSADVDARETEHSYE